MGRTQAVVALALMGACSTASAQSSTSWQRKWYWGGQAGVMLYTTPAMTGTQSAIVAGGHWLITGKRSALYISVNTVKYDSATTLISDPSAAATGGLRTVNFSHGGLLQAGIYIIPNDGALQFLTGGGFAVNQITDATPVVSATATQQEQTAASLATDDATTKAFLWVSAGFQLRAGRWAVFATYQYMPAAKDFAINTGMQTLNAGLRFALTSAHEDVSTTEK